VASVVFSLLHALRFMIGSRVSLHLEIIALRHQLNVVTRSRCPRLRLTPVDRMLWAWLQLRNTFPDNEARKYLLHDRHSVFADLAITLAGMNIQTFARRRARRGKTPTWNASSARSDASASIT